MTGLCSWNRIEYLYLKHMEVINISMNFMLAVMFVQELRTWYSAWPDSLELIWWIMCVTYSPGWRLYTPSHSSNRWQAATKCRFVTNTANGSLCVEGYWVWLFKLRWHKCWFPKLQSNWKWPCVVGNRLRRGVLGFFASCLTKKHSTINSTFSQFQFPEFCFAS